MAENIFLFVPNLIGYARVILALVSCYYMRVDYLTTGVAYMLSGLLDAFDGWAARSLNQSTKFGAILDMITDRCVLMCLQMVLCHFYPEHIMWLQMSLVIDIASHWIHIWSSMMAGKTTHKLVDPSENRILRLYYHSRPILFTFCAANELFYGGIYLLHFMEGPIVPIMGGIGLVRLVTNIAAPISIAKTGISIIQLVAACINVGRIDASERKQK